MASARFVQRMACSRIASHSPFHLSPRLLQFRPIHGSIVCAHEKPYNELSNYEKFRHDLKSAMRDRDTKTLNPLKGLLTAHQANAKDVSLKDPDAPQERFESDAFLAPLIHRQIAKRQEALIGFKEYKRHDLIEKETYEISVLQKYLPQPQTTEADVRALTIEAIDSLRSSGEGANDPGSMSLKRIYNWLYSDPERKKALGTVMADQNMVRRVVAETVLELSDRVDSPTQFEVDKPKPRPTDTLTKDRYQ